MSWIHVCMLISSLYLPKGREHVLWCIEMLYSFPFLFTDLHSTASQHETFSTLLAPRCLCVCVKCMWVNGSRGVAQMRYSSFSTGNKVSLFDSRLAWLSSPEGCLPTSLFLSSSYLFFLLFSPCFLSRGSIMGGWFSSARREQIS